MAGRKKRSETDTPALDLSALDVHNADPGSVTWRESTREPSPLQGPFDASAEALTNGGKEGNPKQIVVSTEDEAKQVVNAVRRAASFRKLGAKVKTETYGDGVLVSFAAKPRKAGRKYTPEQLRTWAASPEGAEYLAQHGVQAPPDKGMVPAAVSKAYREAHNL
jgi:hypothetical protein